MTVNYNTQFLCTYKSFSDNYYSNLCYQIQLLQAFNISLCKLWYLLKNLGENS